MEEFLNKATPWKEGGSYLFTDNEGVTGVYRKEPEYSGRAWSTRILTEEQDWCTVFIPKCLPTSSIGSYSYLIDRSAFDFENDPKALIHDFLWPWDLRNVSKTNWVKHENGNVRVGYSRHGTYRHIRRYITYITNEDEELPTSNVLFQYIVGPIEVPGDKEEEQATSSKQVKNEDFCREGSQKKEAKRRKSEKEKKSSKTPVITTEEETKQFLENCTLWGEDGCYKFLDNGVIGLYHKDPEYSGKIWALEVLTEMNDWSTTNLPTYFPLNSVGSFRYLVDPSVFDFEKDPKAIVNDLLHPWDGPGTHTRWSNTEHENGNIRHGISKHVQYRNIRRYITFFSDEENLPISHVLYQYIVEPLDERTETQKPSTSKTKNNSEKRKREPSKAEESEDSDWEETSKKISKRKKSDNNEISSSKNTPAQRKTKEETKKPLVKEYPPSTPTPPISEPFMDTPLSSRQKKQSEPFFMDLEQAFNDLQQSISEMKGQYCSLTNPLEMTAMNQKIIKLLGLESEIKNGISTLAEHTKNMTRDIMMDMEAPLPTFNTPLPAIQDNSEADTPQRRVFVKIE